jgi:hypothetical protein
MADKPLFRLGGQTMNQHPTEFRVAVANLTPEGRAFLEAAVAVMTDPEQSLLQPRILRGDVALTMKQGRAVLIDRVGWATVAPALHSD